MDDEIKTLLQQTLRRPALKQEGHHQNLVVKKNLESISNSNTSAIIPISLRWKHELRVMSAIILKCVNCGAHFMEKTNIGTWKCAQHAQPLRKHDTSKERGYYPCCGVKEGAAFYNGNYGCVPCDHTILGFTWTIDKDYQMPKNVFDIGQFNVQRGALVKSELKKLDELEVEVVTIRRFDNDTHDRRFFLNMTKPGRE